MLSCSSPGYTLALQSLVYGGVYIGFSFVAKASVTRISRVFQSKDTDGALSAEDELKVQKWGRSVQKFVLGFGALAVMIISITTLMLIEFAKIVPVVMFGPLLK